mgnify:CR=1 FL=1
MITTPYEQDRVCASAVHDVQKSNALLKVTIMFTHTFSGGSSTSARHLLEGKNVNTDTIQESPSLQAASENSYASGTSIQSESHE